MLILLFKIFASVVYLVSFVFTLGDFAHLNCSIPAWNIVSVVFNVLTIGATIMAICIVASIMKRLEREIDRLSIENNKFSKENIKLETNVSQIQGENNKLETNVSQIQGENIKLNKSIEEQKKINRNLVIIQNQSQELLNSLTSTGDDFKKFGNILNEATSKNLSLTDKLQILLTGLTEEEFNRLDKNKDGYLTLEELRDV